MSLFSIRTARQAGGIALVIASSLLAAAAQALSIGEAQLQSHIGEPLRAIVPLGHLGTLTEQDLIVGRAPDSDYRHLGVTQPLYASALRYELMVDAKGMASVKLSSEQPVSEPFVDLVMEVRWPTGRAIKEFNLLLDIPAR